MPRPRPRRRSGSWSSSPIAARSAVPIAPIRWRLERPGAELDGETWKRVFSEAAALGALHVHLSGGEPTARRDIAELTRHAAQSGLYTNLITSGIGVEREADGRTGRGRTRPCAALLPGRRQGDQRPSRPLCRLMGAQARVRRHGDEGRACRSPSTRSSIAPISVRSAPSSISRVELGARRLEVAHTQYYGWALANRAALMPPRAEVDESIAVVEEARTRLKGELVIDMVVPDYYARYPKPCAGGWGRIAINVSPSGKVLPCHAAETIPGLEFWNVRDRRLPTSGATIRPSRLFAARNGCSNPAARATGARSTGAAAAVRRWR